MKWLDRWQLYLRKPVEEEMNLTPGEQEWWDGVALPIRVQTFLQAMAITTIGFFAGSSIMATIAWAKGEPTRMFALFRGTLIYPLVLMAIPTAFGWPRLLRTKQQQMVRSRRLREAMMLEDSDVGQAEPRRLGA